MASPSKPTVPTVLLINVCSLDNKIDHMRLSRVSQRSMRNCCIFIFFKTDMDTAVGLEGMALHRVNRDGTLTWKQRGGGLVIYINNSWRLNIEVVSIVCTLDIEALTVRCPFYLPWKLSANIIVAVYVLPSAHVTEAMEVLHDIIGTQQTAHPGSLFIAAGDYNQAS